MHYKYGSRQKLTHIMADFLQIIQTNMTKLLANWTKKSTEHWYQPHLRPWFILILLSYLYRGIFWLKKFKDLRLKPKYKCPIIVVGNITVGGTGKTPVVIWLANYLKAQSYKPGVISRGYGAQLTDNFPQLVTRVSDPYQVGDEPVLIARRT